MWVYNYFENDKLEFIKEVQYQMYDYEIGCMFDITKNKFTSSEYSFLYLETEERESYKNINTFDHRLIQGTHDNLAAVFRYKIMKGEIKLELFELEDVKSFFENILIDTLFLQKIPKHNWNWCVKWHQFIENELYNERNHSVIRNLSKALFVHHNFEDSVLRWSYERKSANLINELYNLPLLNVGCN